MQRWHLGSTLGAFSLALSISAQEPGPLATSTEKLDYLLSTWRGKPVSRVREVFGRETETGMRGTNPVLVYEKRVKVRPAFGGITIHGNGGLRCIVRFLIDDETQEVSRVARDGGGDECWDAWRKHEP